MDPESSKPEEVAAHESDKALPHLSQNLMSYVGWVVTIVVVAILVVLVGADILYHQSNPYNSVVTYMILPGFLAGGVALILLGMALEWRRRHKARPGVYPALPVINLNTKWQRRRITLGLAGLAIVFTLSAVGTYQAYHFTESPEFCGQVCHMVMKPEYTAYQYSPHAHVRCAECHIGSGADWYVKSKMSGLRQVWAVATKSYKLPIETPVHNLRPARETCEECHWPGKFSGSMEKEIWHFAPDQTNSPMRYNLLMKVGGGEPEVGQGQGIHWHINSEVKVRYWSPDRQRMTIPWVEVTIGDQPPKVFKTEDCPDPLPEGAEIRVMDCIDCHNRPSHVYRSPRQLLDHSFSTRILDSSLPFLKRYSTELLETNFPDTPAALQTIDKVLREKYADRMAGARGKELVEKNIALLQTVYQRNFFPEQGVSWREYPSHLGHFEFPGCYRCHDDKHLTETKEYISNDCTLCHKLVDQAEGEAAFDEPVFRTGPFQHPRNLGTIWEGRNCTDCHGLAQEKGEAKLASAE